MAEKNKKKKNTGENLTSLIIIFLREAQLAHGGFQWDPPLGVFSLTN